MKKGFTLIELLVVVLIIGVLAAIALPMYQKAVLKSRFAALMPIVKAMNDSNEAYYLEHNSYASNPQDLPVQGQLEYPDGTELEFGSNIEYAYVLATNPDARNNYVMYQKHSVNYPGEIHCEALDEDAAAQAICASYGSNNIGQTITPGYTTYVIEGSGMGWPFWAREIDCDKAPEQGLTCKAVQDSNGAAGKRICIPGTGICRTQYTNEDGSYTNIMCSDTDTNGKCRQYMDTAKYNADGKLVFYGECQTVSEDGTACSVYKPWVQYLNYDANGKKISSLICKTVAADGTCSEYRGDGTLYTYDSNGHQTSAISCSSFAADGTCSVYNTMSYQQFATYDANGNLKSEYRCRMTENGVCNTYIQSYQYQYDDDGKTIAKLSCKTPRSNGTCSQYNTSGNTYYTYDDNGNVLQERSCSFVRSNGTCSKYSGNTDYTYDANGNLTYKRKCSSSSDTCSSYSSGYEYVYDNNGNQTVLRYCQSYGSNGVCNTYQSNNNYFTTYDDNGQKKTQFNCSVSSTGDCDTYLSRVDYTYNAAGQMASSTTCTNVAADGSCNGAPQMSCTIYDDEGERMGSKDCNSQYMTSWSY